MHLYWPGIYKSEQHDSMTPRRGQAGGVFIPRAVMLLFKFA